MALHTLHELLPKYTISISFSLISLYSSSFVFMLQAVQAQRQD